MKLNFAVRSVRQPGVMTFPTTHEGAPAFVGTAEQQLRRTIMACMLWESGFYESGETVADRIKSLVPKIPFETVAQIAIEARTKQHLRHVPLLIAVAAAKCFDGKKVGDMVSAIIQRPDEAGELLSIFRATGGGKTIPRQFKVGIGRALRRFTEYQLAKWDQSRASFSLADVIRLCHVRAGDDREFAMRLAKIANKTFIPPAIIERYGFADVKLGLDVPDTWETNLSKGADKKETFERLITEGKLGAMALLRNLRGMSDAGVQEGLIRQALLTAKTDRVLPFRFIAAAKHAPQYEPEIESAMLRSLLDAPKLAGKTVLLVDVSGSMTMALSGKSDMSRIDAACGLAILLREVCETIEVIAFGSQAALVPARRGFALASAINAAPVERGTDIGNAVHAAATRNPERLIMLTDEQSMSPVGAPPCNPAYLINIATNKNGVGYGPWTRIDGWSESIVKYIVETEQARTPTTS